MDQTQNFNMIGMNQFNPNFNQMMLPNMNQMNQFQMMPNQLNMQNFNYMNYLMQNQMMI